MRLLEECPMSNDKDYRNKIEEHRQEVEMEDVATRRTRSRRNNIQKKKQRNPLIKILVFVFICIPLLFLAYFWLIYKPEPAISNADSANTAVQIEKNEPVSSGATDEDKEEEKDKDNEEDASTNNGQENDSAATEPDVDVSEEDKAAIAQQAEEAAKKLKEAEEKKKAEAAQANQTDNANTHVVQSSSDTLYSIAVKYYKDPKMVDKIKQANNLKSDSIMLGQTLILP